MGTRKNAGLLSADDANALRRGYAALYGLRDNRGFAFFAGLHGLPLPEYCQHGNLFFLPWHRAYLYYFERALQRIEPGATLAWWDWSSVTSHAIGLPDIYRVANVGGVANPLAAGPVTLPASDLAAVRQALPGAMTAGRRPQSRRDPDIPDELPKPTTVMRALGSRTFTDFSRLLEGIHNGVHGWVGGAMSAVPIAAYDPVFWAHHTMIDRLWYLWQLSPNGFDPPGSMLGRPLPPFPMTVRDTLSIANLGYEYAAQVVR